MIKRIKVIRQILCLLLCIILLSLIPSVHAEEGNGWVYQSFRLRFELNEASTDPEDANLVHGLSELCRVMSIEGTAAFSSDKNRSFDLQASLLFENTGFAELRFHLYGYDSKWFLSAPLLGETVLMIDLDAMNEFAIKAWNHLSMPLQLATMWIPYTHTSGLRSVLNLINEFLGSSQNTRTVSYAEMTLLAQQLAEVFHTDRSFKYWLLSVSGTSGLDTEIQDRLVSLPDHLASWLNAKGLRIQNKKGNVTWSTVSDNQVLYTVSDNQEGKVCTLTLPALVPNGYEANGKLTKTPEQIKVFLNLANQDGVLLEIDASAAGFNNLPCMNEEMSANLKLDGRMTDHKIDLQVIGESHNDITQFSIQNAKGEKLFHIILEGRCTRTDKAPVYTFGNAAPGTVNVFSVNDASLRVLENNIKNTLIKELLPVLVQLPAPTCQTVMDFLSDYGVIALLLGKDNAE